MHHDHHDEGLVHSHNWAADKRGPVLRPARPRVPEPDYDDGLVHGHAWACGERGRMAGARQG